MLRVGLTGGLASGKSFVGQALAELGCHLLKADEVGHELLEPAGAAYAPVLQAFGREILDEDGRISRPKLAAEVFGDENRLQTLNSIIHPLVFEAEDRFFESLEDSHREEIGIVEAAILIETGNHTSFDTVVVAWCPREMQIERAIHRGLSREEALARLASQMPLDEKLSYADFKVDTSGPKEVTRQRVAELYEELQRLRK